MATIFKGCISASHGGQFLVAVGKDGNNDLFSIAYVVIEAEYKDSWLWLLEVLDNDVGPFDYRAYTFMSDRQKVIFSTTYYSL